MGNPTLDAHALDGGDDLVGIGDPCEGLGLLVVLGEEAVDGGLEIDDGMKDAAFQAPFDSFAKKPSTALRILMSGTDH